MKAYILSLYQENGAEDVEVTLDLLKLPAMLTLYSNKHFGGDPHDEEKSALNAAIEEGIAIPNGRSLSRGWGGIQLHIVDIEP